MRTSKRQITRRRFLARTSTSIAVCSVVPGSVLGLHGAESPNNRLNIAAIGLCNQGASDLQGMTSENIVALCDVDTRYTAKLAQRFPQAKQYQDFRKMFDAAGGEIDAVLRSTAHPPVEVR